MTSPTTPTTPRRDLNMSNLSRTPSILQPSNQPTLANLKLSHILNGETCHPISFTDFASFIAHKEFSAENLLFVIWFRSYNARWAGLRDDEKAGVVVPSTRLSDRYDPFGYVQRGESGPIAGPSRASASTSGSKHMLVPPLHDFKACEWTLEGKQACQCGDTSHRHEYKGLFRFFRSNHTPSPTPILNQPPQAPRPPQKATKMLDPKDQPMREEAQRAFATFMRKSGSRELGISDELRQFAKLCLAKSTAPEVFLPIYEEVYSVIENQSLPNFLSYATANVNRPKQMYWYLVGSFDIFLGVAIFTILTLLLSPRHFAYRAIRLPSTIFTWFGAAQFYSAYRGFCQQVWGRASLQVKPWELDPEYNDEETGPTDSGFDDSIFTPKALGDKDGEGLHYEVHPLSDFGGSMRSPTTFTSTPWETMVLPTLESEGSDGDELSEAARRQLAIRRATVKIPDASLAFPIKDVDEPSSPISATSPSPLMASIPSLRKRSEVQPEISPFESFSFPEASNGHIEAKPAPLRPSSLAPPDLTTILDGFPLSGTQPYAKSKAPSPRLFGPERVVEDPRIKELYHSIARDILIVSGIVAVIWVALCLAVPLRGLA